MFISPCFGIVFVPWANRMESWIYIALCPCFEADITVQRESDLPFIIMMPAVVYRKISDIGKCAG